MTPNVVQHFRCLCATFFEGVEASIPPSLMLKRDIRKWHEAALEGWAERVRSAQVVQTSTCSAIASASSTSIPRYLTVLSIFVWPSRS